MTILQAFPSKFDIFFEFSTKFWTEIFNVLLILADAATYGCIVKNNMGSDSTSAVLMVSNLGMRHWIERKKKYNLFVFFLCLKCMFSRT